MKALPLLAPILLLTLTAGSCQERVRITPVPAELTQCADEPDAPSLPEKDGTEATQLARDTLTLAYILSLRSAYGDCKSKVDGAKAWNASVSD